ncbi:MAG: hypothetical protein KGY39_08190 [Anaerolineales bacterium]|nr:hypothetical protein [Anaerolineales bacterium]
MKKIRHIVFILMGVLISLVAISALSNLGLPTKSEKIETLSMAEKARIKEYFHLRETLGDEVWSGWGSAEIPVIVHNEAYAFLVGYNSTPPNGWTMVPSGERRGGKWEEVPEDTFFGLSYYRQPLSSPEKTPENFTVKVGEKWVATMMTREYAKVRMVSDMRGDLPPGIRSIVPYRLIWKVVMGATETYVGGLAHESFHAYQGTNLPDKLAAAERSYQWEDKYPLEQDAFVEAWKHELDLLMKAVLASSLEESRDLASQFLAAREERRKQAGLTYGSLAYERNREWLEGMAKYAELTLQRRAGTDPDYQPLPVIQEDPDFSDYHSRERYWKGQVKELQRMAGRDGDIRFYYSGFAQGVLLDRFLPGWKERLWSEDIWLEELLAQALEE